MKDNSEVESYLTRLAAEIDKACESYIGRRVVNEATLESIRDTILKTLEPRVSGDEHLQFMVGESPDDVVPANLYTALRMVYGVYAPSWEACACGEWIAPDGGVYIWRDGRTYMHTTQPDYQIIPPRNTRV